MPDIIEICNLTKTFSNGFTAVENINLSIKQSEFTIIAGANGSGKTVLMKHLNGLLTPTSGKVKLNGVNIQKDLQTVRQKVGLIFQNSDIQIVGQTVERDIAFGPENMNLSKIEIQKRVDFSLEATGLQELRKHQAYNLSGGEKKRLGIAGVLAMDPEILIFDEPFAGLDYPGVKSVLKTIVDLHREGKTIILITHDLEKSLSHSDKLVIMQNGEIVECEAPGLLIDKLDKYNIKKPYGDGRLLETMTWMK